MIWQHRAYHENAFASTGGWFRPPSAGDLESFPTPTRMTIGQAPAPASAPAAVSIFMEPRVLGVPVVPALLVLGGVGLVLALASKKKK